MKKKTPPKKGDPYAVVQTIKIEVPYPLLPLCKLLQITPNKIISDLLSVIGGRLSVWSGLVYQDADRSRNNGRNVRPTHLKPIFVGGGVYKNARHFPLYLGSQMGAKKEANTTTN